MLRLLNSCSPSLQVPQNHHCLSSSDRATTRQSRSSASSSSDVSDPGMPPLALLIWLQFLFYAYLFKDYSLSNKIALQCTQNSCVLRSSHCILKLFFGEDRIHCAIQPGLVSGRLRIKSIARFVQHRHPRSPRFLFIIRTTAASMISH